MSTMISNNGPWGQQTGLSLPLADAEGQGGNPALPVGVLKLGGGNHVQGAGEPSPVLIEPDHHPTVRIRALPERVVMAVSASRAGADPDVRQRPPLEQPLHHQRVASAQPAGVGKRHDLQAEAEWLAVAAIIGRATLSAQRQLGHLAVALPAGSEALPAYGAGGHNRFQALFADVSVEVVRFEDNQPRMARG